MKTVMMILVLLGGVAISGLNAQACKPADCKPCPPGCCIIKCCPGTSAAAASATTNQLPADVLFASLPIGGQDSSRNTANMSRKEMNACKPACKTAASCTPAPSCQPSPACHGKYSADTEATLHAINLPVKNK